MCFIRSQYYEIMWQHHSLDWLLWSVLLLSRITQNGRIPPFADELFQPVNTRCDPVTLWFVAWQQQVHQRRFYETVNFNGRWRSSHALFFSRLRRPIVRPVRWIIEIKADKTRLRSGSPKSVNDGTSGGVVVLMSCVFGTYLHKCVNYFLWINTISHNWYDRTYNITHSCLL